MRPSRARMSCSDVASAKIAITSLAAVMSNPVCRGTPSNRPPSPTTMLRSARSLTSSTRFQVMSCRSRPTALPWWRWLSTIADEQVVRRGHRVEVAGEVQVEDLHRHDLAVAAAGRAALDPEGRTHRRLADRHRRPPPDVGHAPGRARPSWWSCPRPAGSASPRTPRRTWPAAGRPARRSRESLILATCSPYGLEQVWPDAHARGDVAERLE